MKRVLYFLITLPMLAGCSNEELPGNDTEPEAEDVKRAVLVYAVNRSSLSADFIQDSQEMLEAMRLVDNDEYQLLVFKTDSESQCGLYRAAKNSSGDYGFKLIKSFPRDVTSTHPDRIEEVAEYALNMYPAASYDLVFWGHGMSWKPYFTNHNVAGTPMQHSYGGEYNPDSSSLDWTEIDELADALPDNKFDTVWFDCCYMSGIEVIYEFRDKCSTFVGYPTEVWQYGLAYDRVLPYLMCENPDVVGAARAFYDYYEETKSPVTVAVINMSALENVAEVAREIVHSGSDRPEEEVLLNYSRSTNSPFYDFTQFFSLTATLNGRNDLAGSLKQAMRTMVTFHAESGNNFYDRPWDVSSISGVSTHYFKNSDLIEESYYRTLDWYARIYL